MDIRELNECNILIIKSTKQKPLKDIGITLLKIAFNELYEKENYEHNHKTHNNSVITRVTSVPNIGSWDSAP